MQVRALQHDTLDAIVYRYLGASSPYLEQTLELNPTLATCGVVLPHGTVVTLPERQPQAARQRTVIQLWD